MNIKTLSIVAGLVAAFGSSAALATDEYTMNQNMPSSVASTPRLAVERTVAVHEYDRNLNSVAVAPSGLQRAQVVAEAIEARKLGLLVSGEQPAPSPTAAQLEQIHLAGLNAVRTQMAAK